MKPKPIYFLTALFSLSLAISLPAQVPQLLNYQGKLAINGVPATNMVTLTFSIYPSESGGAALWSETQNNVPFTNGLFNVQLGEFNTLPNTLFTRIGELYLGIKIGTESAPELTPRSRLNSVAFAIRAKSANSLAPDDAPDGNPAVVVDKDGKVGIGTMSPNVALDVVGNAITLTRTGDSPLIRINRNDASGTALLSLARQGRDQWVVRLSDDANNNFEIGDTINTRLLINTTGNVGIGTASPKVNLDVADNSSNESTIRVTNSGPGYAQFSLSRGTVNWAMRQASNNQFQLIYDAGGEQPRMTIDTDGNVNINGRVCATGGTSCTSDIRLKKNIIPISSAIDKVTRLRGVSFDWRKEEFPELNFSADRNLGFIAQEIKDVLPEVVSQDAKGYYSVAYSQVVPVLVEAIKEQQKELAATQAELQNTKAELASFKEKISRLESSLQRLEQMASYSENFKNDRAEKITENEK